MKNERPNLFIVGAPKAGTTSFYRLMKNHPDIYFPEIKEPNFFSSACIEHDDLYYQTLITKRQEDYLALYKPVQAEKVVAEASVSYLYYSSVASDIKNFSPDAKVIISLREPVDRAYSHYLMDERLGYVNKSFSEIFHQGIKTPDNHFVQNIGQGRYLQHVKEYIDVFGRENVLVVIFDDIKSNLELVLQGIFDFLHVAPIQIEAVTKHNVYQRARNPLLDRLYKSYAVRRFANLVLPRSLSQKIKKASFEKGEKPQLDDELKNELKNYYREDVQGLSELLDLDLVSRWGY